MKMNRIEVHYTPAMGNVGSCLEIRNDIKGWSNDRIGTMFYGQDADMMLEIMRNINYDKMDNFMSYGIYVNGPHHYDEYYALRKATGLSDIDMKDLYQRLDELELWPDKYIKLIRKYKREGKDVNNILEDWETKSIEED